MARDTAPDLTFAVTDAHPVRYCAVPTLAFRLRIARDGGGPIRAVHLTTTVRINPARRTYDQATAQAMTELFGQPERWATTLRPLVWTRITTVVGQFQNTTEADLELPCAYDTELALGKYFHAVRDGDVPLDFLFSGTIFYEGEAGHLSCARISWNGTASYALPADLWHRLLDRYFSGSPWLRLSRASYDLLSAYRTRHALSGWDETVRFLLDQARPQIPGGAPWTP